jgi:hypothetical protein
MMTRHAAWHMWRLSEAGDDNLGLACSDDGLLIGRTPLIEKRDGHFAVREQREIERLLSRAYRSEISADRIMSGLTTVARALNTNDQCLARIAAVHLRIPDIPDRTARNAMEATDVLIKYARGEDGGGSDWNPALHPRTGTPPNPGWFAPTDDSGHESFSVRTAQNDDLTRHSDASASSDDDWVKLPPGEYIDELRDFLEWLFNAKPEEEMAIRGEIKRLYYDVGDTFGGNVLNAVFSDVLEYGSDKEWRQQLLDSYASYAKTDPALMGVIHSAAAGLVLANPRMAAEAPQIAPAGSAELPERSPALEPSRGGRLGSAATRAQNAEIAAELERNGFTITHGGGQWPEEYIRGSGPGTLGSTYVDITAVNRETGAVTRVQTVDTLSDGGPTPREAASAARIRAKFPNDVLILIQKRSTR